MMEGMDTDKPITLDELEDIGEFITETIKRIVENKVILDTTEDGGAFDRVIIDTAKGLSDVQKACNIIAVRTFGSGYKVALEHAQTAKPSRETMRIIYRSQNPA